MLGAESTLPSRMIANGWLTFSVVSLANLRAALLVEGDRDDRLVVLLIVALLRVGQLIALDPAQPLDRDRRNAVLGRIGIGHDLAARRGDALGDVGGRGGGIDQLEFELGGLAEQALERRRILEARHLHHDAADRPGG